MAFFTRAGKCVKKALTFINLYIYTLAHTHIHTHAHTHTYTHMHTHIHIHAHTYTHTRARSPSLQVRAYDAAVHWSSLRAPESEEEVPPAFAGLCLAARRPLPAEEGSCQVGCGSGCV